MTTPAKISLSQQIEALDFALVRQRSLANGATVRPMRGKSIEQYDCDRLSAALATLRWVQDNRALIQQLHDQNKKAVA